VENGGGGKGLALEKRDLAHKPPTSRRSGARHQRKGFVR
jgi:hypothetical protein